MTGDGKPEKLIRPEFKVGDPIKVSSDAILEIITKDPILKLDPKPQKGGFLRATIIHRDATRARIKLANGYVYVVEISNLK
ncbi:MAG TPA: hypothetical protein VJB95_03070 [Candidatus Paceibacterota bacterium]